MHKKLIIISFCSILFLTTAASSITIVESELDHQIQANTEELIDSGWVEEYEDVTILHLNGSYYDMGYQHGVFAKEKILANFRMIQNFFDQNGYPKEHILEIWNFMKKHLPQQYIDEMQGMADALDVSFEQVAAFNMYTALFNHIFCTGGALWDSASIDGELYHLRSLDWAGGFKLKDKETNLYLWDTQLVIIRKPTNGYASLVPDFAGTICCWGGINEQGISISETTCLTYDTTFNGISAAFRMRMVLDNADSAEKAINIMNSNRTCGWTFIISDGKIPKGYVVEQTANFVYIGNWFDPVESIKPFWSIENVVRRSPMFISPTCSNTQKNRPLYNPSGIRGLLLYVVGKNPYFLKWTMYKALSNELEIQHGTLDMNKTMDLLRNVYLGKTNIMFSIFQKMGAQKAFHQWVACPKTGEIVVSFADKNGTASENQVHHFNLFTLINASQN